MDIPPEERKLVGAALGVVVFAVIAVMVFLYNFGALLFYIAALIAFACGFYLSRGISKQAETKPSQKRR